MPGGRNSNIYGYRLRCLLLLRNLCLFSGTWVSWRCCEENLLWIRIARIDCHHNDLLTCKLPPPRLTLNLADAYWLLKIPAKYIFVHILRGSRHLNNNTVTHWVTWLSCTSGIAVIAYIIASSVPVFNSLVSLIGALLGTLMCFQPMGCMWLYDNWAKGRQSSRYWMFMVCWSIFVVLLGCFLTVAGTYGSIVGIIDSYRESGGSAAFSCADNSNST